MREKEKRREVSGDKVGGKEAKEQQVEGGGRKREVLLFSLC